MKNDVIDINVDSIPVPPSSGGSLLGFSDLVPRLLLLLALFLAKGKEVYVSHRAKGYVR